MRAKKLTQSRSRVSFSVDRNEVDISTDWVQAVMGRPQQGSPSEAQGGVFFGHNANTATGEQISTEAVIATGEVCATADAPTQAKLFGKTTTVPDNSSVANNTPVEYTATVAQLTEVEMGSGATAAILRETGRNRPIMTGLRTWKPRPIRRITDGLTTGQFAVYSIMYEHGEPTESGCHVFSGGYADLCRLAGMSKRGIQNVVAELQVKSVIALKVPPGHYRTETSVYSVPAGEDVVGAWLAKGWRFAVGKSKRLTNNATVELSTTA